MAATTAQDTTVAWDPLTLWHQYESNPNEQDMFDFEKMATVFKDVVGSRHARSVWGQEIEPALISLITEFAAPYVLFSSTYMRRCMEVGIQEKLLRFDPGYRAHKWWWNTGIERKGLLDMEILEMGPRIFAGGLSVSDFRVECELHESTVLKTDADGNATWLLIALDVRGTKNLYMDLIVHAEQTMMDVLTFAAALFAMSLADRTHLVVWGLDSAGNIKLDSVDTCVELNIKTKSPVVHMKIVDVFGRMLQAAEDIQVILNNKETDVEDYPFEWECIKYRQLILWNSVAVRMPG